MFISIVLHYGQSLVIIRFTFWIWKDLQFESYRSHADFITYYMLLIWSMCQHIERVVNYNYWQDKLSSSYGESWFNIYCWFFLNNSGSSDCLVKPLNQVDWEDQYHPSSRKCWKLSEESLSLSFWFQCSLLPDDVLVWKCNIWWSETPFHQTFTS